KIADRTGQIQLYLQQEALGAAYEAFKGWDVGDLVGASGALFRTRTGELSVRVDAVRLLVKSLRPLPEKWHGLAATETRYRRRPGVVPQAPDRRRARARLRDQPQLPQRGAVDAAQPGIHDARAVPGVRRLP